MICPLCQHDHFKSRREAASACEECGAKWTADHAPIVGVDACYGYCSVDRCNNRALVFQGFCAKHRRHA